MAGVIHRFIETNGIRRHIPRVFVLNLTKTVMLPGCGHGTQQAHPDEVNTAMIVFLRGL